MIRNYIYIFAIIFRFTPIASQEQITIYTFYTPSHETLLTEWFLPSLQDDCEVVIKRVDQKCPSGTYMETGWIPTMLYKVDLILDAIKEHWGEIIVYADVDIQFFAPIASHIHKALEQVDFAIQQDNAAGRVCAGFFALKANENTQRLFKQVRKRMLHKKESDNPALEALLRGKHAYPIAWDYLPISFFSTGVLSTKTFSKPTCWQEGDTVIIPEAMILHHANFTKSVESKIKLLHHVKSLVQNTQ